MATSPILDPAERRSAAPSVPATGLLRLDPVLLLAVIGLGICSVVAISETRAAALAPRQAVFFAIGLLLALAISQIDYSRLRELKWGLYGLALAAFLVDRARQLRDRETTARAMLLALVPTALVLVSDLGSGLVYIVIALAALFVAGTSAKHFAALFGLGAVAIALALVVLPQAGVEVLKEYQVERLTSFLHPSEDPSDAGYQQNQSVIAIGSGERLGRGEQSTQTILKFLPEEHTDFLPATIGERWGFVGLSIVLSLYALLVWRALRILTMAKNLFGAIIAGGIVSMLLFQVFVNVGMNVGIMPITGIPAPLLSYGGSSVLATLLAIGLLQSIHVQARTSRKGLHT